MPVQTVPGP